MVNTLFELDPNSPRNDRNDLNPQALESGFEPESCGEKFEIQSLVFRTKTAHRPGIVAMFAGNPRLFDRLLSMTF